MRVMTHCVLGHRLWLTGSIRPRDSEVDHLALFVDDADYSAGMIRLRHRARVRDEQVLELASSLS